MLSNIGRAAVKRIGGSHLSTNRFLATIWQLQRVEGQQNAESTLKAPSASFLARRLYATATKATQTKTSTAKKPATKKATAKKPATKEAAAKKPAAKKPAAKKAATKAAKKPVKKPVKKKVKAKAKPKKKKAVVLTDSQKLRKQLKELKVAALLSEEPKLKAENAFFVFHSENSAGTKDITLAAKDSSAKYKSASTEELERLNRLANENKAANAIAFKKWVESHTPEEIRLANKARKHIRRLTNKTSSPRLIKDDRAVKAPSSSQVFFLKERHLSGDFAGIKPVEAMKRSAVEFRELSPEQRKPYDDAAAADLARYLQEYRTVYKHESPKEIRDARAQS